MSVNTQEFPHRLRRRKDVYRLARSLANLLLGQDLIESLLLEIRISITLV